VGKLLTQHTAQTASHHFLDRALFGSNQQRCCCARLPAGFDVWRYWVYNLDTDAVGDRLPAVQFLRKRVRVVVYLEGDLRCSVRQLIHAWCRPQWAALIAFRGCRPLPP